MGLRVNFSIEPLIIWRGQRNNVTLARTLYSMQNDVLLLPSFSCNSVRNQRSCTLFHCCQKARQKSLEPYDLDRNLYSHAEEPPMVRWGHHKGYAHVFA